MAISGRWRDILSRLDLWQLPAPKWSCPTLYMNKGALKPDLKSKRSRYCYLQKEGISASQSSLRSQGESLPNRKGGWNENIDIMQIIYSVLYFTQSSVILELYLECKGVAVNWGGKSSSERGSERFSEWHILIIYFANSCLENWQNFKILDKHPDDRSKCLTCYHEGNSQISTIIFLKP